MEPSTNPFEVCDANDFIVDNDTITELARIGASGDAVTSRVGSTYLRVLIARSRARVVHSHYAGLVAVDSAHGEIYPAVLAGVTTADCSPISGTTDRAENARRALERNRRSNFARTAASTVRSWVALGGDLADIDVATITKADLIRAIAQRKAAARDAGAAAVVVPGAGPTWATDRAERTLARAHRAMVRALHSIKSVNVERARELCDPITRDLINTFEESI